MREKNYDTGLRGVLFEECHYARMGSAIWLYGWLVLRQTHQTGTTGWVLGGAPVTYREIEGETGFNRRTLERWMSLLRRNAYIATEAAPGWRNRADFEGEKTPARGAPGESSRRAKCPQSCGDGPQGSGGTSANLRSESQ
jgi:hypothetical protein